MNRSSQALVVYDPRSQTPPAFLYMEMLHDIIVFEQSIQQAQHPNHVHDISCELRWMFFTMHHLGDWSLFRRVTTLLHRARVIIFRQCHEYLLRCAVLVDACHRHQHSTHCRKRVSCLECPFTSVEPAPSLPSYDSMALAVAACDDVLRYLVPSMKQYYIHDLRPCLVAFMADSDTDCSECESYHHIAKRLCSRDH